MRVYEVMSKAVETARQPEHRSNRDLLKAGRQEDWLEEE